VEEKEDATWNLLSVIPYSISSRNFLLAGKSEADFGIQILWGCIDLSSDGDHDITLVEALKDSSLYRLPSINTCLNKID
jgi:hypothetical protein